MKKNKKLLYDSSEWSVDSIAKAWKVIDKIAKDEFGLDYYDPQIELITYDQMLDAYMNNGMPVFYKHWSFGKQFITQERSYREGESGLAYELVINSDPAIAYLMETNSMTMQALVMAHACCGHVHFFKNNYMFKDWTDAEGIVSYLRFAKQYIDECSNRYGDEVVECFLDSVHSLSAYGVDTYKRKDQKSYKELLERSAQRLQYKSDRFREEFETTPGFYTDRLSKAFVSSSDTHRMLLLDAYPERYDWKRGLPEENILMFLEKMSPCLREWEREIIRIVRTISQYFYPQRQTKLMNEGFATAIHYEIMNTLSDRGYISEGNTLEFLHSHTSVCCQREESPINVYSLGFAMFQDIKRMSLNPTAEDLEWFPLIAGKGDWLDVWKDCVANYRDESFVSQFLSPKVIRDQKLFTISVDLDSKDNDFYSVDTTHRSEDVYKIREELSKQYSIEAHRPNIQVADVDWESMTLFLSVEDSRKKPVSEESLFEVKRLMGRLWPLDYGDIQW